LEADYTFLHLLLTFLTSLRDTLPSPGDVFKEVFCSVGEPQSSVQTLAQLNFRIWKLTTRFSTTRAWRGKHSRACATWNDTVDRGQNFVGVARDFMRDCDQWPHRRSPRRCWFSFVATATFIRLPQLETNRLHTVSSEVVTIFIHWWGLVFGSSELDVNFGLDTPADTVDRGQNFVGVARDFAFLSSKQTDCTQSPAR
jgi:hypothetical protein